MTEVSAARLSENVVPFETQVQWFRVSVNPL